MTRTAYSAPVANGWRVAAAALVALLAATPAHASFMQGETLAKAANVIAWVVIVIVPIVAIVVLRRKPTTYYGADSGAGMALLATRGDAPHRVGVIGLGTGTLAAYGRTGDAYRFYEIDPAVVRLSREEFSYLPDPPASVTVVLGDARLSLEREPPGRFDLLVVDAFTSDAIPVHLLTREAFALYSSHLKEDGVLAVHVSNKYLDLRPVVRLSAEAVGKEARLVATRDDGEDENVFGATWVLVTGRKGFFDSPPLSSPAAIPVRSGLRAWTDGYSNLFQVIK